MHVMRSRVRRRRHSIRRSVHDPRKRSPGRSASPRRAVDGARSRPVMAERRRQWRAIKDLRMEKPMILVETCMLPDYIGPDELVCEDPYLRNIEKSLWRSSATPTRSATTSSWTRTSASRGRSRSATTGCPSKPIMRSAPDGRDLAYSFDFSLKTPADADKLHLRENRLDRALSHQRQ